MEIERNGQNFKTQLFFEVISALKNLRRRFILELFDKNKTLTKKEIQKSLRKEGLIGNSRKYCPKRIEENHLIPLIKTGLIEEAKEGLFKRTSLGDEINRIIKEVKEFDTLPPPTHRKLYWELILLELREGRKTYRQLQSRLNLNSSSLRELIKRLKNAGFIKVNHPYNAISKPCLSHFTVSPYYPFIRGLKEFLEKTGRSWFTEYSITYYLASKWKNLFGRPINLEEARQLIKKGVEAGDIIKTNGSYRAQIKDPFRRLNSGRKIFELIEEGYDCVPMLTEKSKLHLAAIYKILGRLKKRNLIEEEKEYVTIELREKGKKLADCLFKIKERVELEAKKFNPTKFSGIF